MMTFALRIDPKIATGLIFMRLGTILLALLSCMASACSPPTASTDTQEKAEHSGESLIPIRIPDTPFMGLLPIYVAEEMGMLEANGLAVRWVDVRDPGQGPN